MIYLRLFYEFFKTGLLSFGGGMTAVKFLYELAERTGWFTIAEVTNMIAISESTPGPIGINMATYAGYAAAGVPGSLLASLGFAFPSMLIVTIVYGFIRKYRDSLLFTSVFSTLRPAAIALMCSAFVSLSLVTLINIGAYESGGILAVFNYKQIILAAVCFFAIRKFKLPSVVFLAAAAVIGIAFNFSP